MCFFQCICKNLHLAGSVFRISPKMYKKIIENKKPNLPSNETREYVIEDYMVKFFKLSACHSIVYRLNLIQRHLLKLKKNILAIPVKDLIKKISIFFLYFLSYNPILSESTIPFIYLNKIENKNGVPPKTAEKIQSIFLYKIHSNYSDKYIMIDPQISSNYNKELQKTKDGCEKDCGEWMEDTFHATHRIEVEIDNLGGKYKVTAGIFKGSNKELITRKEIYLPTKDYESIVLGFVASLFEPTLGVLQSELLIPENEMEIQKIIKKEIYPLNVSVDINRIGFEKLLDEKNNMLIKADKLFNEGDYKNAHSLYMKLKNSKFPENFVIQNPEYTKDFNKILDLRINSSYFNKTARAIESLDLQLPPKDSNLAYSIMKKYRDIGNSISDAGPPVKQELENLLSDRILSIQIGLIKESELKSDIAFDEGNWKYALESYINLQNEVSLMKSSPYLRNLKSRLDLKIKNIIDFRKKYFYNGARTLCSLTVEQYKRKKDNTDNSRKDLALKLERRFTIATNQLEDFFKNSEYIQKDSLLYCEKAFQISNLDIKSVLPESSKVSRVSDRENDKFYYSYLFPGLYHTHKEPEKLKSKLLFYGGVLSGISILAAGGSLAYSANKYNTEPQTPYYFFLEGPTIYTFGIYNDIQTEEKLLNSYNNSKLALTGTVIIYTALYLYSIYDARKIYQKVPGSAFKNGGGLQLDLKTAFVPGMDRKTTENILKLEYEIQF